MISQELKDLLSRAPAEQDALVLNEANWTTA